MVKYPSGELFFAQKKPARGEGIASFLPAVSHDLLSKSRAAAERGISVATGEAVRTNGESCPAWGEPIPSLGNIHPSFSGIPPIIDTPFHLT
jgi:hypothetical protein